MLALLDRCCRIELAAGELYEILAQRFAADPELVALWSAMAADEREHAGKLSTWRALLAATPAEHRPQASGFADDVADLERLLAESRVAAATVVDADDAFAIALGIEISEIDAIYTTLLQRSPLARHPDLQETVWRETQGHHHKLLEVVGRRGRTDSTMLRAALLAAREG